VRSSQWIFQSIQQFPQKCATLYGAAKGHSFQHLQSLKKHCIRKILSCGLRAHSVGPRDPWHFHPDWGTGHEINHSTSRNHIMTNFCFSQNLHPERIAQRVYPNQGGVPFSMVIFLWTVLLVMYIPISPVTPETISSLLSSIGRASNASTCLLHFRKFR